MWEQPLRGALRMQSDLCVQSHNSAAQSVPLMVARQRCIPNSSTFASSPPCGGATT